MSSKELAPSPALHARWGPGWQALVLLFNSTDMERAGLPEVTALPQDEKGPRSSLFLTSESAFFPLLGRATMMRMKILGLKLRVTLPPRGCLTRSWAFTCHRGLVLLTSHRQRQGCRSLPCKIYNDPHSVGRQAAGLRLRTWSKRCLGDQRQPDGGYICRGAGVGGGTGTDCPVAPYPGTTSTDASSACQARQRSEVALLWTPVPESAQTTRAPQASLC